MTRRLEAQSVGCGKLAIEPAQARDSGERRQFVDDRHRAPRRRPRSCLRVECVGDRGFGAVDASSADRWRLYFHSSAQLAKDQLELWLVEFEKTPRQTKPRWRCCQQRRKESGPSRGPLPSFMSVLKLPDASGSNGSGI